MDTPSRDFHDAGVRFLRSYFDLAADRYGADIEPAFAPLAAGLVEFAGPVSGMRMIDLGCGTGLVGRAAAQLSSQIFAADLSRRMLVEARRKGLTLALQADLHRLPFGEGSFGLVLASFAFNSSDPAVSFKEVCRLLQPGGRLVLQEWGEPDNLGEMVSDTLAAYMVDEPPDALRVLREGTELPVPWDDLETVDDIEAAVKTAGLVVERLEVVTAEVRMLSLDAFLGYKLAWPSRRAEIEAMPVDRRQLLMSDLQENLAPHTAADGSLTWRPQVIRLSAYKPGGK